MLRPCFSIKSRHSWLLGKVVASKGTPSRSYCGDNAVTGGGRQQCGKDNVSSRHSLHVMLLYLARLRMEHRVIEQVLQLLVGVIDEELLEAVG